ncbi:hypothetical protein H2203_008951 [Taxawa tesnikishii (nom. ined.)]|nr:hypothetical protein H2203_008951 [Dothideales sp. JES 119]
MGTTITSPDVGLLFGAISRTDGCGPTLSNYLLTLHATEVSSLWGIRIDKTPKSFDFNDLNQECGPDGCYPLVPWKAYANAPGCYTIPGESPKCEKTIMWSYAPQLQYPARMTTLEPAWGSSCGLHIVGVWDPPRVMTTEGSFDVPVATEATTTAPATAEAVQTQAPEASPTISSPAAYETAAPETDAPQTGAEETYYSPHVENTNTVDGTALAAPQPQTQNSAQPTGVAGAILSGLNGQNPSPAQSNAAPGGSAGTTAAQPAVSRAVVIVGSDTYTVSADASSTWVGSSTYKAGDTISSWPAGFSNGNGNGNGNNNGGGSGNGNNGNGAGSRSVASIVTNGIAVGGSTYVFTPAPTAGSPGGVVASGAVINVGGQTQIVSPAGSAGAVAIGSHTLVPGSAAATIEGTVYSAAPNGVVIDGQTVAYSALAPAVTPTTSGAVITVNGVAQTVSYVSGAPGAVVVGSQTLLPGSAAAMIGGTVYSAASSGIVVGSQTVAYSVLEPAVTDAPSGAVVTINGQAQTVSRLADLSGAVVIGSQTLVPGSSAVTIGGTIYSAAPGGLVVGTQTVAYSALQGGAVPTQTGVQITVGGHTTSAIRSANGVVVIGSQTLTPGSSAVTIDGTVYSAAQSGLVVGTQYIPYSALAAATSTATSVSGASGSITRTRASSSPSRFSSEANAATASATTSTKGSAAGLTALCREGLVVWLGCIVLTLGAAVAL